MRRKVLLWGLAGAVVLGAFGLYWFQPWKLFTAKTVNDAAPAVVTAQPSATAAVAATATPAATLIGQGALITHEHTTSGTAQLVRLPDGRLQLVLRDLATSDGPDLRIWLTDQPVKQGREGWHVFDDGKYVELGRLKGTHGTQVYDVPAGVEASQYTSVTIWCKRFAVSFGAAPLTAT